MFQSKLLLAISLAGGLVVSGNLAIAENSSGTSEPVGHSSQNSMSPIGIWHKREGASKFEIYRCGLAHCGKIVYLSSPIDPKTGQPRLDAKNSDSSARSRPLMGVDVLLNMVPGGQNYYEGKVYNAEDGRTYSGNLTQLSADQIKLKGCVFGGLICLSDILVRTSSS